ncbi:NusG domain II-containing protein [Eubacterium sp.]|uniref:NusG domain II-containing protein n=1 Tax=Eubacterium sp. TaxID=142586 RepID=UPI0025CFBB28|nr:NusG domain II-containing protein [Eubacterium sp.]MCR5629214.1 NusG domain II-containing protein [Eubacterium sp.]
MSKDIKDTKTNEISNKKIEKALWIIILGVAVVLFIFLKLTARDGEKVSVRVDGKEIARYELSEDREVVIDGYNGGVNTLIIKDKKAYIKDADCPDKLCEHQGKIHMVGQSLVCLPHRVVVEIVDD